ncbi:MAG TPA: FemAB family XrtA/PEP-CTERM system-associated protein [Vicinamibacterales bacterium]|nr:FemAB family XrtA/PEP-CTERM system-associated protein [Vicinamibacterales bacterium]
MIASQSDREEWDRFVSSQPDAAGYHEWVWRDVIERAFGHRAHYLMERGADGAIAGVLPIIEIRSIIFGRSFTSLPFVNFGGVLAPSDTVAAALLDDAGRLAAANGVKHVELRHIGRRFESLPCRQHKVTMRLPLSAGMFERIDRKARNQVRKAEKSGLTVTRGGAELVEAFYRVFARNMRDLGTPVYSRKLFDEVMRALPDRARIIVVSLQNTPVAAGLTIRTRDLIEIPWASSIRDYNSLCPNHLLYWHAIDSAVAEGVATFDFGRSTPGEGTFKFKEQWGAQPVPLHWEYWLAPGGALPDQSPKNPKFRLMIETWKRLPLWIANAAGPHIVSNIP